MVEAVKIVCPQCGEEDQAKILGIEVSGVYDGILIWWCQNCSHQWPRFSEEESKRLHEQALLHIEAYKAEREAKK